MPHDVIMPALGMAQDTGLLVAWHKNPGDPVASGDVLFEVETDKSTMEVEAQADGYLSHVKHSAGQDVPVGQVIAQITDTPEQAADAPAPAAASAELPTGHNIIMPALGMAQDTGLIVSWHKSLGDAVAAQDILFEVETDKSTMEVEAGQDGYLAALLYPAGSEAPVGETIAIISTDKPLTTVAQDRSIKPKSAPTAAPAKPDPDPKAQSPKASMPTKVSVQSANGKILASPKARRMAMQLGLDLNDLVQARHPQPYHVADIEVLRTLAKQTVATGPVAQSLQLKAKINPAALYDFTDWSGTSDDANLIAKFAASAMGAQTATVTVASPIAARHFSVDQSGTAPLTDAPDSVDLMVFDLRNSPLQAAQVGSEHAPTLTLIQKSAKKLTITLEYSADQMTAHQAITFITEFSQILEQPLRRLL